MQGTQTNTPTDQQFEDGVFHVLLRNRRQKLSDDNDYQENYESDDLNIQKLTDEDFKAVQ